MRKNIGIYASNDWPDAKVFADQLRAEGPCTVRIRDGRLFTPDQRENFDIVFVKGDFSAVMDAYPDVRRIDEPSDVEAGEPSHAPSRSKRGARSKDAAADTE
jgi:hypothetical protein